MINLDNVSKVYPAGARPALDTVSMDIAKGEFVFLIGQSGSGKTTVLRLLLRDETSDGWTVIVEDATASYTERAHTEALLAHARTFGRVAYADEVLAELSG